MKVHSTRNEPYFRRKHLCYVQLVVEKEMEKDYLRCSPADVLSAVKVREVEEMVFNPWRIDIQGIRWARETNGFICSILSSSLTSNLSSSSSLLPLPWFKLPSGFNVYRESEQDWRTTNSSPSCYFFRNLKRGVMRRPFEQIVVGLRAVTSQRSLENEMGCSLHTAYIDWREKQQHKKKNHGLLIPLLISSWEESTDKRVMTHDYCNRIGLRQDWDRTAKEYTHASDLCFFRFDPCIEEATSLFLLSLIEQTEKQNKEFLETVKTRCRKIRLSFLWHFLQH